MFDLQLLVDAVKRQGADIAPTYSEYLQLALALATDCGEAGRSVFHELCSLSPKYRQADADKMYTRVLRDGHGLVHLGTVFHLARQAGVEVASSSTSHFANSENMQSIRNMPPRESLTHGRAYTMVDSGASAETGDAVQGSEPYFALPVFASYEWPWPLQQSVAFGATRPQKDILLLGTLTVLGAGLGRNVHFSYGGKCYSPTLQTFIIAPPASGKGALSFTRCYVEPIHREVRRQVEARMKAYRQEKAAYDTLGKERSRVEPPRQPANKLFLIPANNTGTGILQNLIDSDGTGLIFEPEADTVSSAIGSDYGHWSDTLRKVFDHDPVAYNRRTDHEYREVERTYLSVLLSGTPAQVQPLIPSAENGLFSRQLFYYMPAAGQWQSQFDRNDLPVEEVFRQLGKDWKQKLDRLKMMGIFQLVLTSEQEAAFDALFGGLFGEARRVYGNEMSSSVVRMAVNICRLLSIVAILRVVEADEPERETDLLHPAPDIAGDNLKDKIIARWELAVRTDDFQAVMALAPVLYRHATHILSFLPATEVVRRPQADQEDFFALLPDHFTRQELLDLATEKGLNVHTVEGWKRKFLLMHRLEQDSKRGCYKKLL